MFKYENSIRYRSPGSGFLLRGNDRSIFFALRFTKHLLSMNNKKNVDFTLLISN